MVVFENIRESGGIDENKKEGKKTERKKEEEV